MQSPETLQERWCWSPETFDAFVCSPWEIYQILGESGWGKTFFLFGFIGALQQRNIPYLAHRLEEDQRHFLCSKNVSFCILDESQRLLKRDWKRLLRQIQRHSFRLVVASHQNHHSLFESWKLRHETQQMLPPSPAFLKQWIEETLQASKLPKTESLPEFSEDILLPLLEKGQKNLHLIRRFLYEILVKFNEQGDSAIRCWNWDEIKTIMNW